MSDVLKETSRRDKIMTAVLAGLVVVLFFQSVALLKTKKELKAIKSERHAQAELALPARAAGAQPRALPSMGFSSLFDSADPFEELARIQERMNHIFNETFNRRMDVAGGLFEPRMHAFEPSADMKETATDYVIKLDLPGMDKDRINVEVQDNLLTVSGERKFEQENADKNGFRTLERSYGSFSRSLTLPADVNADSVNAEYKDGVLTVKLAKVNPEAARKQASKISVH